MTRIFEAWDSMSWSGVLSGKDSMTDFQDPKDQEGP